MTYEKIDPEFKRKWVEALRSGKYKQGPAALRREVDGEDYFCCLGVACDIQAPELWEKNGGIWSFGRTDLGDRNTELYPPTGVYKLAPICRNAKTRLVGMNDNSLKGEAFGATFNDIADWIEANL